MISWLPPFLHRFSGVEKHAQTVAALLQGRFIARPAWVSLVEFGLVLLTGLLLTFLLPGMRPAFRLILCLACLLALGGLMIGALTQGIWMKIFFPGLLVIVQYILATARRTPIAEKEIPAEMARHGRHGRGDTQVVRMSEGNLADGDGRPAEEN